MVRVPTNRPPTHPGEILLKEFLEPMGLTQSELAEAIHVPYQRVNEIVNARRGITEDTSLRLAAFFGNSPDFWINLQVCLNLYKAKISLGEEIKSIQNCKTRMERNNSNLVNR